VTAPDYVEPIEAWRVWLVDQEFRLRSVVFDAVWLPEQPLEAICQHQRRSWRPPWRELRSQHEPPSDRCRCGIYGADRRRLTRPYESYVVPAWAIGRVVGLVALWGSVVECDRGWRASHAYPSQLCAPVALSTWRQTGNAEASQRIVEALGAYGVDVGRADSAAEELTGPRMW
jgi:hypothetical protein